MDMQIIPRRLSGAITPPPSKSIAHRAILALLLSDGEGSISNLEYSQDIEATKRCANALKSSSDRLPLLDCSESGSTLRFLIPIALALRGGGCFIGHGRLMQRPQTPYFDLFDEKGITYEQTDHSLTVRGTLPSGEYRLPGNVSSQFVTGLLYALPLLDGSSVIRITSPLESRSYVDMTIDMLNRFGISIENQDYEIFHISGGQQYHAHDVNIEADWSQAAFWYAANALGNDIEIQGMREDSSQGDKIVTALCRQLSGTASMDIDISNCPDLLPPLAVLSGARPRIRTRFIHAERLRMKESDRLETTAALLQALGVHAHAGSDNLTVDGLSDYHGGIVDGADDHRIVMAAAIAATRCRDPVIIRGAEAVSKSYPAFWEDYRRLGGAVHVI